ncbi:MAG: 1,4-dihydroxy-2-naphthoate polyprenyltransferase [Candidatus Desulfatibia sp.]|uniref:1,4-dihydroxy-2-naphthoate polyprenyltransferase n=1 Tax=Candidatus Desulfatibia sp. TaxID=3101189 RepID=UPI002F327CD2
MERSSLNIWVQAARPKTLWASVAPVVIGSAMAFESGGLHIMSALSALLGAVLIQIGTNFANDYFDFHKGADSTDRLGPTRVVQAGLVPPPTMKAAFIAVFVLAVVPGAYLIWRAGWPLFVIGVLSILFGILYTAGPYPLGYVGLGELFVIIFFGPVAVGGTYYVQTLQISWPVIISGLAPGLFSVAILTVNNLRDVQSDHRAGKKTLAVRFGVTFSKIEYLLSIAIACLIPLILLLHNDKHLYSLLTSVILLAAIPSIKTVFTAEGIVLNHVLESTGKMLLLYSLIFSIGWIL